MKTKPDEQILSGHFKKVYPPHYILLQHLNLRPRDQVVSYFDFTVGRKEQVRDCSG